MTAEIEGEVIVFLIGMRINRFWKLFEHLDRYAIDAARVHRPAGAAFNRAVGNGGIWHETYRVRPGDFECVYNNVPLFGLARATRSVPAAGPRESARGRIPLRP